MSDPINKLKDEHEKEIRILQRTHAEELRKQKERYESAIKRLQAEIEQLISARNRIPWLEIPTIVEEKYTFEDFRDEIKGIAKFVVRDVLKGVKYDNISPSITPNKYIFTYLDNTGKVKEDGLAIDLLSTLFTPISEANTKYVERSLKDVEDFDLKMPKESDPKYPDMKLMLDLYTHRYRKAMRTRDIFIECIEKPITFAKELANLIPKNNSVK